MATSRRRSPSPSPPPPYEDEASYSNERKDQGRYTTTITVKANGPPELHHHNPHQTIPKSADSSDMVVAGGQEAQKSNEASSKHTQRLNELNKRHTCTSPGARHNHDHDHQHYHNHSHQRQHGHNGSPSGPPPLSPTANHDQFVRSLAAPRSFLGHISIEPLAFLAILALYIEFPAIQDLIYTKICLEVIQRHPNLTIAQAPALGAPILSPDQVIHSFNGSASNTTHSPLPQPFSAPIGSSGTTANQSLATNGRIQQLSLPGGGGGNPTAQPLNIPQVPARPGHDEANQLFAHNNRQQHLLCDRLNKTAVPRDVRQEILDIDSLFWLKYQILVCLLCALASPYWGGLSDRIGRLIPLNVPIVAALLCNAISLTFGLLISLDSHSMFHLNWLFLGAVLVGLSGGQGVLLMNAFSFLSDNTTSEERSKRVTTLESVIFVAHSAGFFLSKMIMLLGLASPERPWLNRHFVAFTACVALNLISILYSAAKLRHHKFHRFMNNYERERQEAATAAAAAAASTSASATNIMGSDSSLGDASGSHVMTSVAGKLELSAGHLAHGERLRELTSSTPDDPDGPIARADKRPWNFWDTLVTFRYYRETFEMASKPRETRSTILLLLLSGFISSLSLAALMSLLFVYVKTEPFNWTTSQYSSWNSLSSVTRGVALISLTVLMKFAPFWSVPDSIVAGAGFLGKGVGLITIGLAQSTTTINWSLVAFTFSEYSMPPIRSLLSKLVVRDELGKVYSCLGSLQSLCFILGNVAFYIAFTSYTQQDFFRLSFLVVGGIELCAVVLMLAIYSSRHRI